MAVYKESDFTPEGANALDQSDPLQSLRQEFCFPSSLYFAGHSLGLRPQQTEQYIQEELDAWAHMGVKGHLKAKYPWLPYHELVTTTLAKIVGAKESEVVAMNTLTGNLHLMLVSFYRPTPKRYKILIEKNTFPSDKYAVDSQARFHGFDPQQTVVELDADDNQMTTSSQRIQEVIEQHGDSLALVMLGNCNYLSGQCFDMEAITQKAKSIGAMVGFNLAHGAGNLELHLHHWQVDFAVWCSYKYLNSGPGGIAGAFVHQRHHRTPDIARFEGWWGHNKKTRFAMGPWFDPIPTVEAWQLSNPPIFQLAALRSSLDLFERATMDAIIAKRDRLTRYLEQLLQRQCPHQCTIITPPLEDGKQTRGAMLCIRLQLASLASSHSTPQKDSKEVVQKLQEQGIVVDFRSPDIIRITPAPLYNNYSDVYQLVQAICEAS